VDNGGDIELCEECGYTLLHRLGCPQASQRMNRYCRICDGSVENEDAFVAEQIGSHVSYVCLSCLEEMDLYDIKELLGIQETLDLVARLTEDEPRIRICRSSF
jgi:hypothetical protein